MPHYVPRLLERVSLPASEPITLAEAKLFLRVDGTEDDALITDIISAVREVAEQHLRASLVTQSWMLAFDDAAPEKTELSMGPVVSVTSVKLVQADASESVMSASLYHLSSTRDVLVFDQAALAHRVEITYAAGYGDATDIPQPIRQGMLVHAASLYSQRDLSEALPPVSKDLYRFYRRGKL